MLLNEILYNVSLISVSGKTDVEIKKIDFDSRNIESQTLFVAIKGTQVDGHEFIEKAIKGGATAIICEILPKILNDGVVYIQVTDSPKAMGISAANFYGNPSKNLILIGITGTNGKTSIATLLFELFRKLGYRCGLISTVENKIEDQVIPSTHTTPDSVRINELLAQMKSQNCAYVFMEVSSHAVTMERISGLQFAGGIFTNITQDHLDFHGTFDNYIKAKKGFFDRLPKTAFALTNADDKNGAVMLQNSGATKYSYSLKNLGNFKGKILECGLFGLQMDVNGQEVWFKLIGKFNAYNLLAVYGTAILLGENSDLILEELSLLKPPPGRFEQVLSKDRRIAIVDYAHTPDALENVLETINDLKEGDQRVITVIGCGGNRDKGKRPLMAKIAANLSDITILTSDNPRNEDPNSILEDMTVGIPITKKLKTEVIVDRRDAILKAVEMANPTDIILVAGKGHETYQDIKGIKSHFDDKEELLKAFRN